jgi:hypothetical protein
VQDRLTLRWDLHDAITESLASADPAERLSGYVMQHERDDPKLAEWLRSQSHKRPPEVKAAAQRLSAPGLSTLSDAQLLEHSRVVAKMLESLGPAECAGLVRGKPTDGLMKHAMKSLDEQSLKSFAELVADAMSGQLSGLPHRKADEELAGTAIQNVFAGETGERQLQAMNTLRSFATAPDEEVCWVGRKLLEGVPKLEDAQAQALSLLLVSG